MQNRKDKSAIMNILYFGKIVDDKLHKEVETKKQNPYNTAQYSYEKAFCDEICNRTIMEIVSINQMKNFPKSPLFFGRRKQKFQNTYIKYIHYINIAFLKEICYFISTCVRIIKWAIKNRKQCDKCIYSNTHYAPVSLGIVLIGSLLKIKKIVTFTDLSLFTYSEEKIKRMPLYKRIVIRPYVKLVNKLQQSYDLYVLFSKPMNNIVNPKNKPYVVMEGIYNPDNLDLNKVEKKNAIAHAGTLNKEVGIDKILEVFSKIKDRDLELWLIGKGDMEETIKKETEKDKRIKFIGFIPKNEVFEYLKKARLLVNLRNPKDIYTKYSFPSKTFEYMVSGTPFFTTKLDGITEEYYNFLYTTNSYDTETIANEIEKVIHKEEKELDEFGMEARRFILQNKNAKKQINKVLDFLNSNI